MSMTRRFGSLFLVLLVGSLPAKAIKPLANKVQGTPGIHALLRSFTITKPIELKKKHPPLVTPEPASLLLIATGITGLALIRHRTKQRNQSN